MQKYINYQRTYINQLSIIALLPNTLMDDDIN